jgi:hypothetical protein
MFRHRRIAIGSLPVPAAPLLGLGPADGEVDPWMAEAPAFAELAAASVQRLVASGRDTGPRVRRVGPRASAGRSGGDYFV